MLTEENYQSSYLSFRDRQAGISLVYSPKTERFSYNAFCLEAKVLEELDSMEFDFLGEALAWVNAEYETWELKSYDEKGCSTCANNG